MSCSEEVEHRVRLRVRGRVQELKDGVIGTSPEAAAETVASQLGLADDTEINLLWSHAYHGGAFSSYVRITRTPGGVYIAKRLRGGTGGDW